MLADWPFAHGPTRAAGPNAGYVPSEMRQGQEAVQLQMAVTGDWAIKRVKSPGGVRSHLIKRPHTVPI